MLQPYAQQFSTTLLIICGLLCLGFYPNACSAQRRTKPLSVYLELGGAAGIASLNIEQTFSDHGTIHLAYRLGLSGFPIDRNNGFVLVIPAGIHVIAGDKEKGHNLDLSLGQNLSITTKRKAHLMTTLGLGYRYQQRKKPWFFRIAYTPMISYLLAFQYQHWAGMTLGYSLNR